MDTIVSLAKMLSVDDRAIGNHSWLNVLADVIRNNGGRVQGGKVEHDAIEHVIVHHCDLVVIQGRGEMGGEQSDRHELGPEQVIGVEQQDHHRKHRNELGPARLIIGLVSKLQRERQMNEGKLEPSEREEGPALSLLRR